MRLRQRGYQPLFRGARVSTKTRKQNRKEKDCKIWSCDSRRNPGCVRGGQPSDIDQVVKIVPTLSATPTPTPTSKTCFFSLQKRPGAVTAAAADLESPKFDPVARVRPAWLQAAPRSSKTHPPSKPGPKTMPKCTSKPTLKTKPTPSEDDSDGVPLSIFPGDIYRQKHTTTSVRQGQASF